MQSTCHVCYGILQRLLIRNHCNLSRRLLYISRTLAKSLNIAPSERLLTILILVMIISPKVVILIFTTSTTTAIVATTTKAITEISMTTNAASFTTWKSSIAYILVTTINFGNLSIFHFPAHRSLLPRLLTFNYPDQFFLWY